MSAYYLQRREPKPNQSEDDDWIDLELCFSWNSAKRARRFYESQNNSTPMEYRVKEKQRG